MTRQQGATPSTEPAGTEAAGTLPDAPAASPPARFAVRAYTLGIYLLALAVLIQFLLAGLGIFFDYQYLTFWHATVGAAVIGGLSLLLIAVGRLGRVQSRTLWLTAAVFGLVVLQSLLLAPYHMNASGLLRAVSGLHVVNALLIFWVVIRLLERTSARGVTAPSRMQA